LLRKQARTVAHHSDAIRLARLLNVVRGDDDRDAHAREIHQVIPDANAQQRVDADRLSNKTGRKRAKKVSI
jgi:hypothetical protein